MAVRDFSVSACLSHPRIKLLSQTAHHCYMSRLMTKPTKLPVRPANTQISLGIRPVWSASSLSTWRNACLGSLASSYPLNAQRRLIRLGGCPDWSESWLGAQSFCWFCYEAAHMSNSPAAVTFGLSDLKNHDGYRGDATAGVCSYIHAQELLLQHMFLGCNCIYKHFVETKNIVLRFLEHLLFFFFFWS